MRRIYSYLLTGLIGFGGANIAMAQTTADATFVEETNKTITSMANVRDYVAGYKTANIEDVRTKLAAYESDPTDTNKDAVTASIAAAENDKVQFNSGRLYRLILAAEYPLVRLLEGKPRVAYYKDETTLTPASTTPYWGQLDSTSVYHMWRLTGELTSFTICNPNYGLYYRTFNTHSTTASEASAMTAAEISGNTAMFSIGYTYGGTARGINAAGFNQNYGDTPGKLWHQVPGNGGNRWYFKEVTHIYKTITAARYATAYYPFAITLPEGMKAYVGSSENSESIALTEVTGVIPANTALILEADADLYAIPLSYDDATADVAGNLLSGVLVPTSIPANNYAFNQVDGVVGFYKTTAATTLAENKAYLPASATTTGSFIGFNFNGLTGISNAAVDADNTESTVYYDLQGRRVAQPKSGNVYVTAGGQKVYIK